MTTDLYSGAGFDELVDRTGPTDPAEVLHEQRRFRAEQLRELAATAADDELAEVTAVLRQAAQTALAEIDAALSRLRDGSYGRCLGCGCELLPERLAQLPAAALCMPCQQAVELDGA